jgi:hypothetical protein
LWPRLVVLKDNLELPHERAHLRFVHAAPGLTPARVELLAPKPKTLVDELAYAQPAEFAITDPGQLLLEVRLRDAEVGGLRQRFSAAAGVLYTLVLHGSPFAGTGLALDRLSAPAKLVWT